MKRLFALLFALCFAFCLCACGGGDEEAAEETAEPAAEEAAAPADDFIYNGDNTLGVKVYPNPDGSAYSVQQYENSGAIETEIWNLSSGKSFSSVSVSLKNYDSYLDYCGSFDAVVEYVAGDDKTFADGEVDGIPCKIADNPVDVDDIVTSTEYLFEKDGHVMFVYFIVRDDVDAAFGDEVLNFVLENYVIPE